MLKTLNKLGAHVSAFVVSFGTAMMASAAHAGDVENIITTSTGQIDEVANLVNVAAYGGGAVMAATGMLNIKKHVDNPSQNDLRKGIAPAAIGVALLAFPSITGIIQDSIATGDGQVVAGESGAFDGITN